jgi:hypothetical protein
MTHDDAAAAAGGFAPPFRQWRARFACGATAVACRPRMVVIRLERALSMNKINLGTTRPPARTPHESGTAMPPPASGASSSARPGIPGLALRQPAATDTGRAGRSSSLPRLDPPPRAISRSLALAPRATTMDRQPVPSASQAAEPSTNVQPPRDGAAASEGVIALMAAALRTAAIEHVAPSAEIVPATAADAPAPPAAAASPVAPTPRRALLQAVQSDRARPLDKQRAIAAHKLRRAAEIHCEKQEWVRFTPRFRSRADRRKIDRLVDMPVDVLIGDVQAHPERYTRTLLTDVAQRHLVAALNIDVAEFERGIERAARYEGLHSVAGRVMSTVASAASAGVSQVPGVGHALKALKKAVKVLAHELPPNVVNPLLTGKLRTVTDVKEAFKRSGGLPVVSAQIEGSPDMGAIVGKVQERRQQLGGAVERFKGASHERRDAALAELVDAYLDLHEAANTFYKRRIGLNRTQTYSKGWGTAVNGVAAAGAVVTAAVPVAGQVAGPVIMASTIPMQWGAGYLDERRVKHHYNLRANAKWADSLKPERERLHYAALTADDIDEAALRRLFMTQSEVRVAAVREVYEDALGELLHRHAKLQRKVDVQVAQGTPAPLVPEQRRVLELETQIELAKAHAQAFESFDAERWESIPPDSPIGACLDDVGALERATRGARLRKPGERAQIVQRYAQAFHGGLSTGIALPILDGITLSDSQVLHDAQGHAVALHPAAEAATLATGIIGGGVFTAATGEVRMGKAENKKLLSQRETDERREREDAAQWVFQAGARRVDLRESAGYRRLVHTTWDEIKSVAKTLPRSLASGPIGLAHLAHAKWWPGGELRQARADLRAALDAIAASGADRQPPAGRRGSSLSAMKDELYDFTEVRAHLARANDPP